MFTGWLYSSSNISENFLRWCMHDNYIPFCDYIGTRDGHSFLSSKTPNLTVIHMQKIYMATY